MNGASSTEYVRDMQTLFDGGTVSGLSDRQLLQRFTGEKGPSAEAAFEAIVLRHGPMVMRVCRGALGQEHADLHDAFQATFLVLVRSSKSIRRLDSVGSWLFGVATRVARRVRIEGARRRAAERGGGLRIAATAEQSYDPTAINDLSPILQAEVERLPDRLRAVVILCYWEGLTHEQAAARLGCPLGTVRSRVARARSLLRRRLSRRGLEPVAGAMLAAFESPAILKMSGIDIPASLVSSTVQIAGQAASDGSLAQFTSPAITALVERVIGSMFMAKLRTVVICIVLIGVGACGLTLAVTQGEHVRGVRKKLGGVSTPRVSKAEPPITLMKEYVVEPPDLLLVKVLEGLPGRPVSGERLVRPDGKISLGWYGDVYVAGLTVRQVKEKLIKHLRKFLHDEQLGLLKADERGEWLRDDKGEIVMIDPGDSDRLFVEVTAFNSKNYYVQGEFQTPGKMPVTGRERVLDAIDYAGGLTSDADHDRVFLHRQAAGGGQVQTLKVDIDQILFGDDLSTNYQVQPGDRLVALRRGEEKRPSPEPTTSKLVSHSAADSRLNARFDTEKKPATAEASGRRIAGPPTMERLEKRMGELDRKLDQILDALQRQPH